MAMLVVELVAKQLISLLANEAQLLGGVREEINRLKDDLESIKSFLHDAESRSASDNGVRTWVNQVKDLAYDIEDVLQEFMIQMAQPQRQKGFLQTIRKGYFYIHQIRARHYLGAQIERIKINMKVISERRDNFSFKRADVGTGGSSTMSNSQSWHDPRRSSLFIDESDLVGIENPKKIMIEWLIEGDEKVTSICVVGMGGVGKTTLVKKVYDSAAVKKYFHCQAWITVSNSFTTVALLRDALKGFLEATKEPIPQGIEALNDLQLVDLIRNHLQQKRYVIVFDDVWNINAWEAIKYALPECDSGSRVIFTTRIGDIAASVETTSIKVYHLQPLTEKEAWDLFFQKSFRGENKGVCPDDLEEMSRYILKKCGGLPLAIVMIGSLLSRKKKTIFQWREIYHGLASEMKTDSSSLGSLGRILLLSYSDLHYYLKSCFLYFAVFPEDHMIKRRKLIRLWVSERFVEEKQGLTAEEVAENYLNELVSRCMIEVVKINDFNKVQICKIHDLMREILQLKSREESFVTVVDKENMTPREKIRHLAIHLDNANFSANINKSCLRTLLVFSPANPSFYYRPGSRYNNNNITLVPQRIPPKMSDYKFLRVLDLDFARISQLPREVAELTHLRYLSLKYTEIEKLPESIGNLSSLEILDLKGTPILSLPTGILKLKNLVELQSYRFHFKTSPLFLDSCGMTVPERIGKLTSLQKFGSIEVQEGSDTVKELGKLTQLRRLGILQLRKEYGKELCSSLEKMRHLTSLYMVSIGKMELLELDPLPKPPIFLQRLNLKCNLTALPKWVPSLCYLSKLVLENSNLIADPLEALQMLPNLVVLDLRAAYNGQELCCNSGGYPKLKKLGLHQMEKLESVQLENGAMCVLSRIQISCPELKMVPLGIENLMQLQELLLWQMPQKFLNTIEQSHGIDFWKVQHISTLMHIHLTRGRWKTEILSGFEPQRVSKRIILRLSRN